jgi:hypothetical protein
MNQTQHMRSVRTQVNLTMGESNDNSNDHYSIEVSWLQTRGQVHCNLFDLVFLSEFQLTEQEQVEMVSHFFFNLFVVDNWENNDVVWEMQIAHLNFSVLTITDSIQSNMSSLTVCWLPLVLFLIVCVADVFYFLLKNIQLKCEYDSWLVCCQLNVAVL